MEIIKVKQQSTGDNDSLEDVAIAIMNVKTEDGKLIHSAEVWKIVRQFMDNMYLDSNPIQKTGCGHCWHGTGQMLTSYPPQIPEVCCHCGEHRTRMEQVPFTATGHGKFAPHTYTHFKD